MKWGAGIYAGIAAGILATIVEIVLWSIFTDALPGIILRDARLAAAIVMGPGALSPEGRLDWHVLLVATLVHFALTAAYGLILSWLIWRLRVRSSLLAGSIFGLCLYAINMYGFTALFPWFEATRDWITIATHVAFGIIAAGVYRAWANPLSRS